MEGAFYECQRYQNTDAYCMDDIDAPEDRANKMLRMALLLVAFALMCNSDQARKFVSEIDDEVLWERLRKCVASQTNLRNPERKTLLHLASSEPIRSNRNARLDSVEASGMRGLGK